MFTNVFEAFVTT